MAWFSNNHCVHLQPWRTKPLSLDLHHTSLGFSVLGFTATLLGILKIRYFQIWACGLQHRPVHRAPRLTFVLDHFISRFCPFVTDLKFERCRPWIFSPLAIIFHPPSQAQHLFRRYVSRCFHRSKRNDDVETYCLFPVPREHFRISRNSTKNG